MKQIISVPAFVIALLSIVSSCKKDDTNAFSDKVKTYIEVHGRTDTFNITYDASGRISTLTHTPTSPGKITYQYSPTGYTVDIFNGSGNTHLVIHAGYFFNSDQFVDSCFQYNDTNDTSVIKYFYNSDELLVEERDYDYHSAGLVFSRSKEYTYDGNGNRITEISKNNRGDIGSTTAFTYSNALYSISIYPESSISPYKHLPLTKTITYPTTTYSDKLTHEYTYDTQNRVIAEKLEQNGIVYWKYYSY